jgi:hypothetical protein
MLEVRGLKWVPGALSLLKALGEKSFIFHRLPTLLDI